MTTPEERGRLRAAEAPPLTARQVAGLRAALRPRVARPAPPALGGHTSGQGAAGRRPVGTVGTNG